MRADRLLRLMMLLRSRERITAGELADELEVSERTVLRDIEALSSSGVPVYAERGRHGGFALVPGWTTDLSGLTTAEARALLVAGSSVTGALGLDEAFASALAKVLSSLPADHRVRAGVEAAKILVVDSTFTASVAPPPDLSVLQRAVTAGWRLQFRYRSRRASTASGTNRVAASRAGAAAADAAAEADADAVAGDGAGAARPPGRRTVDPAGLICAGGTWYLLAAHRHRRRTYRVDRMSNAQLLDQRAQLDGLPDPATWWELSRAEFAASRPGVVVRVIGDASAAAARRDMATRARRQINQWTLPDDRQVRTFEFADLDHAESVLWRHADQVVVVAPTELRDRLHARASRALQLLADPVLRDPIPPDSPPPAGG